MLTQTELLQHLIDNCTNEVYLRGFGWYFLHNTGYMVQLPREHIQSELLQLYFKTETELYKSEEISHHKISSVEKLFQLHRARDLTCLGKFFFQNQETQGQPHLSRINIPLVPDQDVSQCAAWARDVYPQNPRLLQQIGGYILFSPDNRFQKIFLITGPGANGKGTFLRVLTAILEQSVEGEKLATAVDLDEFNQHERVEILGKQLIYDADISGSNRSLRWLKIISGGDKITARGLYKAQITFLPTCKILLLSNPIPNWESSPALTRRLVLLQFKQKFKIDPVKELTLLTEEMLRKWVWYFKRGYEDLCLNGFALQDENNAADFLSLADDVGMFLQERCEFGVDHWIPTECFYREFEAFWRAELQEKKAPPNSRVIGKRLHEYGIDKQRNVTLSDEDIARFRLNEPDQLDMLAPEKPKEQKRRWDVYRGIQVKRFVPAS